MRVLKNIKMLLEKNTGNNVVENTANKRRTKGEKTRLLILESTIVVLAKHGIKKTTHRAIAKVADIQLSLTTYYFKDIEELIYQAVLLNSEQLITNSYQACIDICEVLESFPRSALRKKSTRIELTESFSNALTLALKRDLTTHKEQLAVEQILLTQSNQSEALQELSVTHRDALIAPYIKLCYYFNRKAPELDAEIIFSVIKQIQYGHLNRIDLNGIEEEIKPLLTRLLTMLLQIK